MPPHSPTRTADEHYFPTLLATHGLDNETDCQGRLMGETQHASGGRRPTPSESQVPRQQAAWPVFGRRPCARCCTGFDVWAWLQHSQGGADRHARLQCTNDQPASAGWQAGRQAGGLDLCEHSGCESTLGALALALLPADVDWGRVHSTSPHPWEYKAGKCWSPPAARNRGLPPTWFARAISLPASLPTCLQWAVVPAPAHQSKRRTGCCTFAPVLVAPLTACPLRRCPHLTGAQARCGTSCLRGCDAPGARAAAMQRRRWRPRLRPSCRRRSCLRRRSRRRLAPSRAASQRPSEQGAASATRCWCGSSRRRRTLPWGRSAPSSPASSRSTQSGWVGGWNADGLRGTGLCRVPLFVCMRMQAVACAARICASCGADA